MLFRLYRVLLLLLALCSAHTILAVPNHVHVLLRLEPATKHFWCRYTLTIPAGGTPQTLTLNLNKEFKVLAVDAPRATQQRVLPYLYAVFQDTVQGIEVAYAPQNQKTRQLTITYEGTLSSRFATDQVMEFSGHSFWLPLLPYKEYEQVNYELEVQAPRQYHIISTRQPTRQRPGHCWFQGRTSAIELTALAAKQFNLLASGKTEAAPVGLYKAGRLNRTDTLLLHETEKVVAFYNSTIGRQDPIPRFSVLLPGTNRDAFGLLDNATVITYSDFDIRKPDDRLILAHEISHKWWSSGSFVDYNDWLNESFAVYSSLLYVRAAGDTATFRQVMTKHSTAAVGAPAILGFQKQLHDYPTYRRVVYSKGTVVLAALHKRLGDEKFLALLAATATQKTATTEAFLALVEQLTGADNRAWLLGQLTR